MPGLAILQEPRWLLSLFVAGGLLGWPGVGERRWATVPALATLLAVLAGAFQLYTFSDDLTRAAAVPVLGLFALRGVSRLPSLPWRVGVATVLVPLLVPTYFLLGGLLFISLLQMP